MNINPDVVFTEEEADILHEVMNIAFGSAAADLEGILDIYVVLNVPTIKVLKATELVNYLRDEIKGYEKISIVEQNFMAKFKGIALLIFPSGIGKSLTALLDADADDSILSDPMGTLESETLLEVGNILVGACVGKIAELLGDNMIYSPPHLIIDNLPQRALSSDMFDPKKHAIILQTIFRFKDQDIKGTLFLICSHESLDWLKKALYEFMRQYE
jgi:chemotaxis protein CheC